MAQRETADLALQGTADVLPTIEVDTGDNFEVACACREVMGRALTTIGRQSRRNRVTVYAYEGPSINFGRMTNSIFFAVAGPERVLTLLHGVMRSVSGAEVRFGDYIAATQCVPVMHLEGGVVWVFEGDDEWESVEGGDENDRGAVATRSAPAADPAAFVKCGTSTRLVEGQNYVIDPTVVDCYWSVALSAAKKLVTSHEDAVGAGRTAPYSVQPLFDYCLPGLRIPPHCAVVASYHGDAHGGTTQVYAAANGKKRMLRQVISIELTPVSFISACFVAFALPTLGRYWHGLYDYDYNILLNDSALESVLTQHPASRRASLLAAVGRPAGIRVRKDGNDHSIACLAGFPDGSVMDMSMTLVQGRMGPRKRQTLVERAVDILY